MRIVDRQTFLTLPAGTVYAKFGDPNEERCFDFGAVEIKDDTVAGCDWYAVQLAGNFEAAANTNEWVDECERMLAGEESSAIDLETMCRDGLFDAGQKFAVFSQADVDALIARLAKARKDAFGAEVAFIRDPARPDGPPEEMPLSR